MKTRNYLNLAGTMALGVAMLMSPRAQAQPLDDRVIVDMPYTTTVGNKTLQPGEYVIQRLHSQSGSGRVLLIYSDNGMKFETSTMSIPVLDLNTARDTKIVLSKIGDDYYYDKIWVQGKQYGYEIPLPKEARQRRNELMARVTVPASTSGQSTVTTTTTETAQVETPTAVQEERVEIAAVPPEPAIEQPQAVETVPQANEPVVAANPVPVEERPVTEDIPSDLTQTANREMDQNPAPAELPKTAAGWMALVLGGSGLLGAGLKLRRKQ
jgi:hypothetical protein